MGSRKSTSSTPRSTGLSSDTPTQRFRSVNRPDPVINSNIPSSSRAHLSTSSSSGTNVCDMNDPSISTHVGIGTKCEFATQDTGKELSHDSVFRDAPASQLIDPQPQLSIEEFTKLFNAAYNEFYRHNKISERMCRLMEAQDVDLDLFDRLTLKKQNQRYISLLDGKVIFHEVPNAPHGEVIDKVHDIIWSQIDHNTFQGSSDNDLPLSSRCKKRPDASFRIRKSEIPNPRPPWLKLIPNIPFGLPFPSIVVEVDVNNESPSILQDFALKYFAARTSIRLWIAVKIWLTEKKFWVGWGERRPGGQGCCIHTDMAWPPNAWPLATPVNTIYRIPIDVVYGPGIPVPANAPATLDISVEEIRIEIVGVIM